MNNMKKQELLKLQHLSTLVGHFIRYWGFRKIHGEIWTLVYLHEHALSGIELGTLLQVSKALISPALRELEAEGLIKQIPSENSKTKRYAAEIDVAKIVRGVLNRREKPMVAMLSHCHSQLSEEASQDDALNLDRLASMGRMIQMAQFGLDALLQIKTFGV